MAALSVEDKAKGKRIITQFFRTMPGVQKSLSTIFERDGFQGVYRVQNLLYPNSAEIDSVDSLRKALSMILQHIYGMPVEDKEGYFQDILKCKTASQVIRKEKETLLNYMYNDLPKVKDYLLKELVEDKTYHVMTIICQKYLGEEQSVSDMRGFKNQIRSLHDAIVEQYNSGTSEDGIIEYIKEAIQEGEAKLEEQSTAGLEDLPGEAGEKQKIIAQTFDDPKYKDFRDFLIQKVALAENFAVFQQYLDNIQDSSSRIVVNDMETLSKGMTKVKEFRDAVEKELA